MRRTRSKEIHRAVAALGREEVEGADRSGPDSDGPSVGALEESRNRRDDAHDISDEINEIKEINTSLAQTLIEKEIRVELQPGVRALASFVDRCYVTKTCWGAMLRARSARTARGGQNGSAPCIWQTGTGPGGPESHGAGSGR